MPRTLTIALLALLLQGCSILGAATVEEPEFSVLEEDGSVQVRQYGKLLVARTTVTGTYDDTSDKAFRRLAGFIFGDNRSKEKVAMTAPVMQQPGESPFSEKIAMTAPVLQEPSGESWTMSFIMPAEFTPQTLPQPVDPLIEISSIPPRTVATIRFSGLMSQKKMDRHSRELTAWITDNGYTAVSPPRSAAYNPPWTLPPLRRNEIHIDIE